MGMFDDSANEIAATQQSLATEILYVDRTDSKYTIYMYNEQE